MHASSSSRDRRSFISRITGLSAMALISPSFLTREAEARAAAPWDLAWLDGFKGKHRQVFDFGSVTFNDRDVAGGDTPLRVPRNWLNAHKEVYGLESPAVNSIVGITFSAFPINASDAIWEKYSLAERWKIMDSSTGKWAMRNLFSNPNQAYTDRLATVEGLTRRGTVFWQCNNALGGVAGILAAALKMDAAAVREELVAGLMPGVRVVPAHTMAVGLVQERGFTYEKI